MADLDNLSLAALEEIDGVNFLGLGSGLTVSAFVKSLGTYVSSKGIKLSVIPSSVQIQLIAESVGLHIVDYSYLPKLDLVVDGADQIDSDLNLLKGGGGALFRERLLITAASSIIVLANEPKFSTTLDLPVAIEVSSFARSLVKQKLELLGGVPELRSNEKGYPYVTDNGNLIFDTSFGEIIEPRQLYSTLKLIPGVIDAGIFTLDSLLVLKRMNNGEIKHLTK